MFAKILVVAVALVGVQAIEHGYYHEEDHYEPAHYSFEYNVEDNHTGDIKSHKEERDGDLTQGEYSLVEPDGSTRTVKYTVDKHSGFNAEVHREAGTHPAAPQHAGHIAVHHAPLAVHHAVHHAPLAAVHHAPLAVHHAVHHAPLAPVHHAPLAVHHAVHHAPLAAVHHAPIAVHHAPLAVAHHAIPLHHASHGHASSSASFSTNGAHHSSSTYHH